MKGIQLDQSVCGGIVGVVLVLVIGCFCYRGDEQKSTPAPRAAETKKQGVKTPPALAPLNGFRPEWSR